MQIFEQRLYKLHKGTLDEYWDLQIRRGFAAIDPVMQRLVGGFGQRDASNDYVLHLFRYDSYSDWQTRLHGLYGSPALVDFFLKVRKLMAEQDNSVLVAAEGKSLSPLFGSGADWLPENGRRFNFGSRAGFRLDVTTIRVAPGNLPDFTAKFDERLPRCDRESRERVGAFRTTIGPLNTLTLYEAVSDVRHAGRDASLTAGLTPGPLDQVTRSFELSPFDELNPLFSFSAP